MADTTALLNALLGDSLSKIDEQLEEVKGEITKKLDVFKSQVNEQLEIYDSEKPLVVNLGTVEAPKKKAVHKQFKKIIKILQSQKRKEKNLMFVGEAGSGKTKLAGDIAEALKLQFYPFSVGLQTTKSDLLGFVNAQGFYVTSPIREAFENGGVLLLDEFDAAHAGVVTILNSLLANKHCSFPDGIVKKHKDFICICACNTYGRGANVDYVGRNRLDAATLDRFIVVDVGYDTKLEKKLTDNEEWYKIVDKLRKNANSMGVKCIISPRALMDGADLIDAGFTMKEVLQMTIFKGIDKDGQTKLMKDVDINGSSKPEPPKDDELPKNTMLVIVDKQNKEIKYDNRDICLGSYTASPKEDSYGIDIRFGDAYSFEVSTDTIYIGVCKHNDNYLEHIFDNFYKYRDILKEFIAKEYYMPSVDINVRIVMIDEDGTKETYEIRGENG